MATHPLVNRQLFGGAAELAFPQELIDISDFRPVPDHQEVFADGSTDQSLVVEILEHQASVPDAAAARHYFDDLATQNEAAASTFEGNVPTDGALCPNLPPGLFMALGAGAQLVSKGRQTADASNHVQVLVAVIRLPQHSSDLVISLNTPVFISQHSAAAEHAGAGAKTGHLKALPLFRSILASLRIVDYGLFGGGDGAASADAAADGVM